MDYRLLALGAAFAAAPAHAGITSPLSGTTLPSGWVEYDPGGQTTCARGAPFAFFVHPGTSDKVIIDFIGGGACWDADTCAPGSEVFTDSVDSLRNQASTGDLHGVYDRSKANNPYQDWTHVVVPYCTGDVHWGDADVTYKQADGSSFVIHHKGAVNAQAVLDWVGGRYASPSQVLVTGCSAGAYGSIFWTPKIKETWPEASVRQFADSGIGVLTTAWQQTSFPLWNVTKAAPSWVPGLDPTKVDYTKLQLSDFYLRTAEHYPDVRLSEFTHASDFIQSFFYLKMGGDPSQWTNGMYQSLKTIQAGATDFAAFVAPGDVHCATTEDEFYTVASGGVKLVDWLTGYLSGVAEPSIGLPPNPAP